MNTLLHCLALTCVPGQGVVGRGSAGQAEALGRLSASSSPRRPLRRLDLRPELRPDHPQQHDGRGLLPALLVRVGDLLGVGGQVGQTAWRERENTVDSSSVVCVPLLRQK